QPTQGKEPIAAPYAELIPLLLAQLNQMIEDRPQDTCLQPIANLNIRSWPVGPLIARHPDRVRLAGNHFLVQIRTENQNLATAGSLGANFDSREGHVLDAYPATLCRGHQPIFVIFSPQYRGKKPDQRQTIDG